MTDQTDWRTDAKARYEQGESLRTIAAAVGVNREKIRTTAHAEGWERHEEPAGLARTEAARQRALSKWAERRESEADAAGLAAAIARQRLVQALQGGDDKMTRASAVAYGILIDKAQLLAGGATERHEVSAPNRTPEQEQELAKVLTLVQGAA